MTFELQFSLFQIGECPVPCSFENGSTSDNLILLVSWSRVKLEIRRWLCNDE